MSVYTNQTNHDTQGNDGINCCNYLINKLQIQIPCCRVKRQCQRESESERESWMISWIKRKMLTKPRFD